MGISTIEALRNGNHKAFEEVFLAYFDKVKYLLTGLLRSESDAEELAQDIFVRLWMNHTSIDPNKAFSTYLYTTTRFCSVRPNSWSRERLETPSTSTS